MARVWAATRRDRSTEERGATLLEFALVAPLLFLMLFGVIEFARLVTAYTAVWTGAREGARYATTVGDNGTGTLRYLDCAGIRDAVRDKVVAIAIDDADIAVVYADQSGIPVADCDPDTALPDPTPGLVTAGSTVEVTVRGTFEAVVPMVGAFIDGAVLDSTQRRSIFLGVLGG